MDERQILLVKMSWSYLYKNSDLVEEIFIRNLKMVCPQIEADKKIKILKGIPNLINTLVLNIHSFHNTFDVLDVLVRALESEGCDRRAFDQIVLAFLSAIEKIHGDGWDNETKSSWVTAISSLAYRYAERKTNLR